MTTEDSRSAYTRGLREIADFLDEHPEVPLPYFGSGSIKGNDKPAMNIYLVTADEQKQQLAGVARAMGAANKSVKDFSDGESRFQVWREFAGIVLVASANRNAVCTRKVVGVEDREVEEVVTPAVTRKVTKPVEVVEWECLPLLAADASDVAESAIEADPDEVADALTAALDEDAAPDTALCPEGCGCRLGTDDADSALCAERQAAKADASNG